MQPMTSLAHFSRRRFLRIAAAATCGGLLSHGISRLHAAVAPIQETEHFWYRLAPEGPYATLNWGAMVSWQLAHPESQRRAKITAEQMELKLRGCPKRRSLSLRVGLFSKPSRLGGASDFPILDSVHQVSEMTESKPQQC